MLFDASQLKSMVSEFRKTFWLDANVTHTIRDRTEKEFASVMKTNADGAWLVTKHFLPAKNFLAFSLYYKSRISVSLLKVVICSLFFGEDKGLSNLWLLWNFSLEFLEESF